MYKDVICQSSAMLDYPRNGEQFRKYVVLFVKQFDTKYLWKRRLFCMFIMIILLVSTIVQNAGWNVQMSRKKINNLLK